MADLNLNVGVKTDPIEYRYSFQWLFRLMEEEGIHHAQLGSFHELFYLPDEFFHDLRESANAHGIQISSVFTTHRELGGFLREENGFVDAAVSSFRRMIEIGALVGARSVGSSPGAVLRDRMEYKRRGIEVFIDEMKGLMEYADERGLPFLNMEIMSCIAEPPTTLEEIREIAEELNGYHRAHPNKTAQIGYLADISHGYIDGHRQLKLKPTDQLEGALPFLQELHLRNTDSMFHATFGFSEEERKRGIVQVKEIRDYLLSHEDKIPNRNLIGYLEIPGPKLGRDYSDSQLEEPLRQSLRHLKEAFSEDPGFGISGGPQRRGIKISASLMCSDLSRIGEEVGKMGVLETDLLHFDIMDARFVPNMPLGLELVKALRSTTDLPFDVHLMVENNDLFVQWMKDIDIDRMSVHIESSDHINRTLSDIRRFGIKAGVALNPATPLSVLDSVGDSIDFVLLMMVNPGFAGQPMLPGGVQKISDCYTLARSRGWNVEIEVDGNVSFDLIPEMILAGADILVAGSSSLFAREAGLTENMKRIEKAVQIGLQMKKGRKSE